REVAVQNGAVVMEAGRPKVLTLEEFRNLTMDQTSPDYVVTALKESALVEATDQGLGEIPNGAPASATGGPTGESAWQSPFGGPLTGGSDGAVPGTSDELLGKAAERSGIFALDGIAPEVFNILCLPAAADLDDNNRKDAYAAAL